MPIGVLADWYLSTVVICILSQDIKVVVDYPIQPVEKFDTDVRI